MRYKLSASSFKHTLFICVLCLLINMNNVIFHGIKLCPFDSSKSTHTLLCDKSINVKHILSSLHLFTPLIILLCFICNEMTLQAINYLKHLVYNHISIYEICYDCGNSCSLKGTFVTFLEAIRKNIFFDPRSYKYFYMTLKIYHLTVNLAYSLYF